VLQEAVMQNNTTLQPNQPCFTDIIQKPVFVFSFVFLFCHVTFLISGYALLKQELWAFFSKLT